MNIVGSLHIKYREDLFSAKCVHNLYAAFYVFCTRICLRCNKQNMLIQHSMKCVYVQPQAHLHLILKPELIM